MKKIVLSIYLVSLFSGVGAQEITTKDYSYISSERIAEKELSIAQFLSRRVYYRNMLTSAKVAMSAWGVVSSIAGVLETFNLYPSEPTIRLSEVQALLEKNEPKTSLKQKVARMVWQTCVSTCAYIGFYYLFSKAEQNYGPAPEIRWFVTVKAPFYATLRELFFLAQEVPISLKPHESFDEMQQLFSKLIDQTEQVIAFMKHKKEQLSESQKRKAEQIIQHLIGRIEVLYGDIAHALESDAYNITFHLDAVLTVLEGDCARFALVEKSIWINPSAILGMMHTIA